MDPKKIEELIKKFNIDVKKLEEEQEKLSKLVVEKDKIDFSEIHHIAGTHCTTVGKEIVGSVAVMTTDFEIVDEKFSIRKATFPYIPGFLAFRELKVLLDTYKKLEVKPDVLFVNGHGVLHPRRCGIASHLGIAIDMPTIGVAKDVLAGEIKGNEIYLNNELKGILVKTREGSKPVVVSVGHNISLKTAVELTKKFSVEPHKFPEPLTQARKFANKIKNELARK